MQNYTTKIKQVANAIKTSVYVDLQIIFAAV